MIQPITEKENTYGKNLVLSLPTLLSHGVWGEDGALIVRWTHERSFVNKTKGIACGYLIV